MDLFVRLRNADTEVFEAFVASALSMPIEAVQLKNADPSAPE